jgi:hypothetical protein
MQRFSAFKLLPFRTLLQGQYLIYFHFCILLVEFRGVYTTSMRRKSLVLGLISFFVQFIRTPHFYCFDRCSVSTTGLLRLCVFTCNQTIILTTSIFLTKFSYHQMIFWTVSSHLFVEYALLTHEEFILQLKDVTLSLINFMH